MHNSQTVTTTFYCIKAAPACTQHSRNMFRPALQYYTWQINNMDKAASVEITEGWIVIRRASDCENWLQLWSEDLLQGRRSAWSDREVESCECGGTHVNLEWLWCERLSVSECRLTEATGQVGYKCSNWVSLIGRLLTVVNALKQDTALDIHTHSLVWQFPRYLHYSSLTVHHFSDHC